jgi:hypothetical protein
LKDIIDEIPYALASKNGWNGQERGTDDALG